MRENNDLCEIANLERIRIIFCLEDTRGEWAILKLHVYFLKDKSIGDESPLGMSATPRNRALMFYAKDT